jgi:anti-sigma B factor antagonist
MLDIRIQRCGDATVLRCHGRIVAGDENATLCAAVVSHSETHSLVLDLARVDNIDAGGAGLLLQLFSWMRRGGVQLKLANVTSRVEHLFKLAKLDSVFAVCSAEEMNRLPCDAPDLDHPEAGRTALFQLAVFDL